MKKNGEARVSSGKKLGIKIFGNIRDFSGRGGRKPALLDNKNYFCVNKNLHWDYNLLFCLFWGCNLAIINTECL